MNRKTLIATLLLAAAFPAAAATSPSLLAMSDTMHIDPINLPESYQADTRAMQEGWFLSNYAALDPDADARPDAEVTDQEIISRLQRLPYSIEMTYNSIVRSYIDAYANRRKQLVTNMLGLGLYYNPIFEQALDRYGLPLELKYLPIVESALNPNAVSRAGATGLWQFMMETAQGEGLEVNTLVDQRRDPIASSDAAARYLQKLYNMYHNWHLALAAYNYGPGNVNKAIERSRVPKDSVDYWQIYNYLPAETRGYVPTFIAVCYVMNYHSEHNIAPAVLRRPVVTDTVNVTRRVHFQQISDVLGMPIDEIRVLNPQYRTDLIPGDIRPYSLVLPSLQVYAYVANEDSILNHNAELYARRDVVEPSTPGQVTGSDSQGQYVEELVVVYHTVKRGETLTSIANKYGVTVASIREANNIGRRVKKGQKLRINTYRRRRVESPAAVAQTDSVPGDSVIVVAQVPEQPGSAEGSRVSSSMQSSQQQASQSQQRPQQRQQSTQQSQQQSRPKTHTVRRGETLTSIAQKYGVTVSALRQANNISGDRINVGQKLKIPAKKKRR